MLVKLNRKPRKGDRLGFGTFKAAPHYPDSFPPDKARFTVDHIDTVNPNLCWILEDGATKPAPFIWWFERDQQYNQLAYVEVDGET